jgi:hypothetical protein
MHRTIMNTPPSQYFSLFNQIAEPLEEAATLIVRYCNARLSDLGVGWNLYYNNEGASRAATNNRNITIYNTSKIETQIVLIIHELVTAAGFKAAFERQAVERDCLLNLQEAETLNGEALSIDKFWRHEEIYDRYCSSLKVQKAYGYCEHLSAEQLEDLFRRYDRGNPRVRREVILEADESRAEIFLDAYRPPKDFFGEKEKYSPEEKHQYVYQYELLLEMLREYTSLIEYDISRRELILMGKLRGFEILGSSKYLPITDFFEDLPGKDEKIVYVLCYDMLLDLHNQLESKLAKKAAQMPLRTWVHGLYKQKSDVIRDAQVSNCLDVMLERERHIQVEWTDLSDESLVYLEDVREKIQSLISKPLELHSYLQILIFTELPKQVEADLIFIELQKTFKTLPDPLETLGHLKPLSYYFASVPPTLSSALHFLYIRCPYLFWKKSPMKFESVPAESSPEETLIGTIYFLAGGKEETTNAICDLLKQNEIKDFDFAIDSLLILNKRGSEAETIKFVKSLVQWTISPEVLEERLFDGGGSEELCKFHEMLLEKQELFPEDRRLLMKLTRNCVSEEPHAAIYEILALENKGDEFKKTVRDLLELDYLKKKMTPGPGDLKNLECYIQEKSTNLLRNELIFIYVYSSVIFLNLNTIPIEIEIVLPPSSSTINSPRRLSRAPSKAALLVSSAGSNQSLSPLERKASSKDFPIIGEGITRGELINPIEWDSNSLTLSIRWGYPPQINGSLEDFRIVQLLYGLSLASGLSPSEGYQLSQVLVKSLVEREIFHSEALSYLDWANPAEEKVFSAIPL